MSDKVPTNEQIRQARRAGFANSLQHAPSPKRDRLIKSHAVQDERRERNIGNFVQTVRG